MSIDDIVKGLLTGFLVAIILLYSFRPKVPYPKWMILTYEHPWLFVILGILDAYLFVWDRVIGVLLFIVLACLFIDFHVLSKKPIMGANDYMFDFKQKVAIPDQYPEEQKGFFGQPLEQVDVSEHTYPIFNDNSSDLLQPGHPSPF